MVEELKLAIKIDDATIEQSLLKQFANAQKMADKVVLDFKNVNFDDKQIEAKFKEMQKKAGQNPIDFSISGNTLDMLGQIDKKLTEIFSIGKGKSFIDSSSIDADIGKIENKINELNKNYEEAQKKISSIGSGNISGKDVVNLVDNEEFKKLSQEVSELKNQFDDLKTHMQLLDDYTVPTDRFFELQSQIETTTVKVSDLVEEFAKLSNAQKTLSSTSQESNISSGLDSNISKYQEIVSLVKEYYELSQKIQTPKLSYQKRSEDYDKIVAYLLSKKSSHNIVAGQIKSKYDREKSINDTYHDMSKGINEGKDFAVKAMKSAIQSYWSNVTEMPSDDKLLSSRKIDRSYKGSSKEEYIIPKKYQDMEKSVIQETIAMNKNNIAYEEERKQIEANNSALKERMNLIRNTIKGYDKNPDYNGEYRMGLSLKSSDKGKTDIFSSTSSISQEEMLQEICNMLGVEIPKNADKAKEAIKEVTSATDSTEQRKDAFPDKDVSASVETATNSIKEENNVLEQNTQKAKENAEAKEKIVNADKEVSNVNLSKYNTRLESYNKKTSGYDATIARFENGGWTSDDYKQRVNAVKEAVKQYEDILNNLKKHPELVNDEELGKLDKQEKLIKENITAVQNMSAAEKGYSLISAQKELDKINNILKEHSGMSREAKNQIKAYYAEIKSGNPSASLDVIHGKIMQIVNAEIEAGRGGKSMLDTIKEKAWYGVANTLGTYFGVNDFIRYGKEGINIVRQLDTALTEMRKVSNESVQSLKRYQDTTFDTADAVGTTAKQIQNSTADWMRLGESMDTAAKSAKDANILLNVSEFEGIDEATDSLVSMSQAYKDLDKMDIIDVLNNIGNNYSISTDGLATALKDSASALVTANNDLNEAVSLTTAGNAITQDPSKVGAGLRTISLRLVGTTQAKQELEDLGEETDGMITTASKLRDTIQSATSAATKDGKGFDIFNSNGNYKSTYEIMQGLADLYDEIVKKDKELGTNNLNLLLETIAGKNRSNIAASILQNGDMLRSVYEDAQNSEGSAEKELNSYLDSVDGKFQQLQNRTQEFWYNVIDTTTVKSVLDFTTDLTEGASKFFKLVEKHLPTILGAIATIIASNKSGGLIRLINFINNSPFLATVEFNREVYELII